ncbi:MAG TPA: fimbria/pilus outer membrane usher protein [Steroidobacteraceae bacterium]|nr:fimbria/pilus outer membrane usher protein [Steroidobacteraceae bacterium]
MNPGRGLLLCALLCGAWSDRASLAQAPADVPSGAEPQRLQLDVSVNSLTKNLIIAATLAHGKLFAAPSELDAVGIRTTDLPVQSDGEVALDGIPGLNYVYHPDTQRLDLKVADDRLIAEKIGYREEKTPPPQSALGLVFNYNAHLQLDSTHNASLLASPTAASDYSQRSIFNPVSTLHDVGQPPFVIGTSANLGFTTGLGLYTDTRLFSPIGTFHNSGFATISNAPGLENHWIRMDSNWVLSNPGSLRTILAGDYITTAVPYTRAVRVAGIQWRSNFSLRPDLITFAVPSLGGSAVVPSAVDLYINSVRQFSGQASGGPFLIGTPPAINGAGDATIVVEDPIGQRITTTVPIYIDARLLKAGLSDYALEAGYARRNYGAESSDYSPRLSANGLYRHGLNDYVTLELGGQATSGLENATFGLWGKLLRYGVLGGWVSRSWGDSEGWQAGLGYRYVAQRLSIAFAGGVTRDDYRDIGSVEGFPVPNRVQRVLLGWSFARRQNLTASYNRLDTPNAGRSRIVALTYSASLGDYVNVFLQGYSDLDVDDSRGYYLGFTINPGHNLNVYASASSFNDRTIVSAGVSKPVDYDRGGLGWTVQADSAGDDYRHGLARVALRGRYGEIQANAEKFSNASLLAIDAAGALVLMDGAVLATRAVNDAFAVVSTDGVAGIPVLHENRYVGETNRGGHFVVPDLHSYERNLLAIDAANLPVDARVGADHLVAVPRDGAGVLAHFVVGKYTGASFILVDEHGKPLPVGTRVTIEATGLSALVGYDGLVFFDALGPANHLSVEYGDWSCTVDVPFDESRAMTTIGQFVCALKEAP